MDSNKVRRYIVSAGLAFIFLSFGMWELIEPKYWIGFIPSFMLSIIPGTILIIIHGIVLAILGLWILSQKYLKYASLLGTAVMVQIIVSLIMTSGFSDILVRDIGILLFVVSLYFEDNSK